MRHLVDELGDMPVQTRPGLRDAELRRRVGRLGLRNEVRFGDQPGDRLETASGGEIIGIARHRRNGEAGADRPGRLGGRRDAGIVLTIRFLVIVGDDGDDGVWKALSQRCRHLAEIAGIHGGDDRQSGGLMHGGARCPALTDEDRLRAVERAADQAEMAGLGAARQIPLAAVFRDELDGVQHAIEVAQRHDEAPGTVAAQAMGADALVLEIGMVVACRRCQPPCRLGRSPRPFGAVLLLANGWIAESRLLWLCCPPRGTRSWQAARSQAGALGRPRAGAAPIASELAGNQVDEAAALTRLVVEPLARFGAGHDQRQAAVAAPAPLAARSHGRAPEKLAGKLRQPLAQRRGKLIAAPAPGSLVKADDAMRDPVQRYRRNLGQAGHGAGKASMGMQ